MLKERTSPVWIASRSPDASLKCKEIITSMKQVQTQADEERAESEDPSQWLHIEQHLGQGLTWSFSSSAKSWVLKNLWCLTCEPEFCPYSELQLFIPGPLSKYLVMPPGPGPTSTTWHPAKDPPALATLSNSRGSRIKFCESRFWAWKYKGGWICNIHG